MTPPEQHPDPLTRLRAIAARLRAPDGGCPWDLEQTHASLRGALVEETYETLAAIDAGDDVNLCEELGDLLLHVVMHAQMAGERGVFTFDDVAAGVAEKMVRRHPHVFGAETLADSAAVLGRWEEIKRREKGGATAADGDSDARRRSLLDGVPDALPALMRAQKISARAARVGFDWPSPAEVLAKVREEVEEVAAETDPARRGEEIGDLLFATVSLARWEKADAEGLLRAATDKFARRFRRVESALQARGLAWEAAPFETLDALWNEAKRAADPGSPDEQTPGSAV